MTNQNFPMNRSTDFVLMALLITANALLVLLLVLSSSVSGKLQAAHELLVAQHTRVTQINPEERPKWGDELSEKVDRQGEMLIEQLGLIRSINEHLDREVEYEEGQAGE